MNSRDFAGLCAYIVVTIAALAFSFWWYASQYRECKRIIPNATTFYCIQHAI